MRTTSARGLAPPRAVALGGNGQKSPGGPAVCLETALSRLSLSVCLSVCLFVCLSVCLSVSLCLSVLLLAIFSVSLYLRVSVNVSPSHQCNVKLN